MTTGRPISPLVSIYILPPLSIKAKFNSNPDLSTFYELKNPNYKNIEFLEKNLYDILKVHSTPFRFSGSLPYHKSFKWDFPFLNVDWGTKSRKLLESLDGLNNIDERNKTNSKTSSELYKSVVEKYSLDFEQSQANSNQIDASECFLPEKISNKELVDFYQELCKPQLKNLMSWNKKLRNPDQVKVDITAYFPLHFEFLRSLCGYDRSEFLNSILLTGKFDTSGGKTGSDFFKSQDGKFIAKSILSDEFKHFYKIA